MTATGDFFDDARIFVSSGRGGDGSVHFRREKFVPLGGPDGGDGGKGGDVLIRADRSLNTLFTFRHRRRFEAGPGAQGTANRRHGKSSPDLAISVPVGTSVVDEATGDLLADLAHHGQEITVARGGKGGLGNSHFATSTRQAPNFAEKGQPAEERWLQLRLKLVADVGLVGLPNAGKSTLLAAMTAARPKIANYPFTTLVPNLGVAAFDDDSFVVADMPGLIQGAHAGLGLGDRFLRHIERTRLLVRVLDASAAEPMAAYAQVTDELRLYDPTLLDRPYLIALNKIDLPEARERAEILEAQFRESGQVVISVSGASHEGLDQLVSRIKISLDALLPPAEAAAIEEFVFTARPDPDSFTVERKRGTFIVHGETIERVVAMTNFESSEAVDHLQRRLKRLGLFQALEREGIRPGNRVDVGGWELTWEGELESSLARKGAAQTATGSRHRTVPGTRASRGRRPH